MEKIVHLDAIALPKNSVLPRPNIEHEWVEYQSTKSEEIYARCQDASVIVTNKCVLNASILSQLPKLKLIAELATGYNNIDVNYCKEHNIALCNIQNYSTQSVSEHALTMMLMLSRSSLLTAQKMAQGDWIDAKCFSLTFAPIVDLKGQTLAIIGSGNIGTKIAELAQAFGMIVLKVEHKNKSTIREGYTPFNEALAQADFISVNCPLNQDTINLIGAKEIALMKNSAFIINNARGGVVNEEDLACAILSKRIAGGASDVASCEPLAHNSPLVKLQALPNFILTPHQAWTSKASIDELCRQFKENVEAFFSGQVLRRIV